MTQALFRPALLALPLLAAFATSAWALPPSIPPAAQPGIVSRSLEQPETGARGGTTVLPEEAAPPAQGDTAKVFTLTRVVLEGSTVYNVADFQDLYQPYIGQKVSFADLQSLAQKMTRRYRQDGYIFSRVILPPQKVADGVLRLRAVEGRIARVEVSGKFDDKDGLVKALADKLRAAAPSNTKDIERYLLLIDDLPGLTARSFVKPSQTPGAGDLFIVVEQKGFEGSASVDNRGSDFIGPWRGEVVGAFNSVFGIHDRTTLRGIMTSQTKELRYGEIIHEEQLGSEGLRLKGRYAITRSQPGGYLSALGVEGDSDLFDLEAYYPLLRSRQKNLNLIAGFTVNNTSTDLSGLQIAEDRIRTVRLGGHLDAADAYRGVNQVELTATQGLGILGATPEGLGRSRGNAERGFLRLNGTVTRIQDLWLNDLSLSLSATGQYSNDPLLASEEFTVGGPGYGRAYDSGELAGDRGYAGVAELRYGKPVSHPLLLSYQAYTYIDYGRIRNLAPVFGEVRDDSLTSAGLGVRFNLAYDMSGYLELDSPLNKKVNAKGNDNPRVFFNLLKRF